MTLQSPCGLFLVTATPLEQAQMDVTEESLKENAKILKEKIDLAHPQLVMNMDKTALHS